MDNVSVKHDKLSFDFFGVNGYSNDGDSYSVRIAKMNIPPENWINHPPYHIPNPDYNYFGRLFEKSPEMLKMLKEYLYLIMTMDLPLTEKEIRDLIKYIEKGTE